MGNACWIEQGHCKTQALSDRSARFIFGAAEEPERAGFAVRATC